ncbi:MAG: hypothetical protein ABI579_08685, partial [Candidatus Sumerlaeota bacterium]
WANRLFTRIPINIEAKFDPLGGNFQGPVILGQASATTLNSNFPGAPHQEVSYATALANQLQTTDPPVDLNGGTVEVLMTFNSDVDNDTVLGVKDWYYGLDEDAISDLSFVRTALHELAHGLGFFGLPHLNESGAPADGQYFINRPSPYDEMIQLSSSPGGTPLLTMSDSQRLGSFTSNNLYFNGAFSLAELGTRTRIYAPSPWIAGSSYNHVHGDTIVGVDELMKPGIISSSISLAHADLMLKDIGFTLLGPAQLPKADFDVVPARIIREGDPALLSVSLTSVSTQPVTFKFQFNHFQTDTATMGSDYLVNPADGVVTIPPGSNTGSITITGLRNDTPLVKENLSVRVTRLIGAEFSQAPRVERTLTVSAAAPDGNLWIGK